MRSLDDAGDQGAQRRQAAYARSHNDLSPGSQQEFLPPIDMMGGLADELTLYAFISSPQDDPRDPFHSSQKRWGFPRPQEGLPEALPVSVSMQPGAKATCHSGATLSRVPRVCPSAMITESVAVVSLINVS